MAISLRATASANAGTSATSLNTTWSTVPVNGDMMLAFVGSILQTTITPPAGWTLMTTLDQGTNTRLWCYYKVASGETSASTWTLGGATKWWVWQGAYAGADTSIVPFWATQTWTNGSAFTMATNAQMAANGWLFSVGACRHANTGAASSFTINDAGSVARFNWGSNVASSNDVAGFVFDSNAPLASGASSPARTVTSTNTEAAASLFTMALGPAAGGGSSLSGATADTVTLANTVTRSAQTLARPAGETVTAADAATRTSTRSRTLADTITAANAVTGSVTPAGGGPPAPTGARWGIHL